jgi:ADP-ribosyl-[dinitrogen reductase] hydrolase
MDINFTQVKAVFFGIAIGDAMGVPVEFMSRQHLKNKPVRGFLQEKNNVWSDDSSLTFCLAESIISGFSIEDLSEKIKDWYLHQYWVGDNNSQEIGVATRNAIHRLENGELPEKSGETGEYSNGNGSLMRVAPLAFSLLHESIEERFLTVKSVSSITHGHIRSAIACFFYVEFLQNLLSIKDKFVAFEETQNTVRDYVNTISCQNDEKILFTRLFYDEIQKLPENEIYSTGYVIHTLEAAIWSFLNTDTFESAVLCAINLGSDTDTTGSVTGALAGAFYGEKAIAETWKSAIVKNKEIEDLASRFFEKMKNL